MASTLNQLIDRVINHLNETAVNRSKYGAVTAASLTGSTINSLSIQPFDGPNTHEGPAMLEINNSLVYASDYNASSFAATVPVAACNGWQGTAALTSIPVGTIVTIDPLWSRWHIGLHLMDAVANLYPKLYGLPTPVILTSTVSDSRYEMPATADEILQIQAEWYPTGGTNPPMVPIRRWSFDPANADGKKYLTIVPLGVGGRPIHVWYRTKPVLPTSPADTSWTWATSTLPDTAEDLAVLRAASVLVMSPEAARLQSFSAEQSDKARFVQEGAGLALSRRLMESYDIRMREEQEKLGNRYSTRPHPNYYG